MIPTPDYITAHKRSIRHRSELEASARCGCFYCFAIYPSDEIQEWIDEGQTALCPHCGIDAVIGDASGYPIEQDFLHAMHDRWL